MLKSKSRRKSVCAVLSLVIGFSLFLAGNVSAGDKSNQIGPDAKLLTMTRSQAIDFLRTTQRDDGSWTAPNAPGITALVVSSLLQAGLPADDPTVAAALKHLEGYIQKDGGIYDSKSNHRNYETCISLMAFNAADAKKYKPTVKNAVKFLRGLQWDEGEGLESTDTSYGGAGYGRHQRPDLSNTQFLIEALKTASVKQDDPTLQKALKFVSRAQNLETEHNNTKFAARVNDGGFYYTPAAGGTSQAGLTANGGLRSYGSMTYAGLKSMIYAGLKQDDPRVKAATNWIRKFYTVKTNPGLGQQGLYYYFHTFAKTLDALGADELEDDKGVKHDWRNELTEQLAALQKENGSWVNKADRWYEGDPNLATAFSLLALSYCEPKSLEKE